MAMVCFVPAVRSMIKRVAIDLHPKLSLAEFDPHREFGIHSHVLASTVTTASMDCN